MPGKHEGGMNVFITKRKLESMIAKERENLHKEHDMQLQYNDLRNEMHRMERNLWDRMNELHRELDRRIDRLADLTLPEEEKQKNQCPLSPPVRF